MANGTDFFTKSLHDLLGINFNVDLLSHSHSKLQRIMTLHGLRTLDEVMHKINDANDNEFIKAVIDSVTNHETLFFREPESFTALNDCVLPALVKGNDTIEIWSAACSTGQEPYSLGMSLLEKFPSEINRFRITATDISELTLEKAQEGKYTEFDLRRGLGADRIERYFQKVPQAEVYQIDAKIKKLVTFSRVNLLTSTFKKKFDIVLCRNVAVYFSEEKKNKLYANIEKSLKDKGYLLTGMAENIGSCSTAFDLFFCGKTKFYRLK